MKRTLITGMRLFGRIRSSDSIVKPGLNFSTLNTNLKVSPLISCEEQSAAMQRLSGLSEEKYRFLWEVVSGQLSKSIDEVKAAFLNSVDIVVPTINYPEQMKLIKSALDKHRGKEALLRCNALILDLEEKGSLSVENRKLLFETYLIKGDLLRQTGAFEEEHQMAFQCYKKALEIMPNHVIAREKMEKLRVMRGESDKMKITEPDPASSPMKGLG